MSRFMLNVLAAIVVVLLLLGVILGNWIIIGFNLLNLWILFQIRSTSIERGVYDDQDS
jgi:hypothetical protein